MKVPKYSPKRTLTPHVNHRVRFPAVCFAAVLGLVSALTVQATVLDNFLAASPTGWVNTLGSGGSVVQTPPEFIITTGPGGSQFAYSTKTASTFSIAPNSSLELKVNVNSESGGPVAVLGWVPSTGTLANSGYSVSVAPNSFIINKNGSPIFTATPATLTPASCSISLRMIGNNDGSVTLVAGVYKKVATGVGGTTLQFEQTVNDPSGLLSSPGSAALGVKNSSGFAAVHYAFLQVFNTTTTVLDSLTSATLDSRWTIATSGVGGAGYATNPTTSGLELTCPSPAADFMDAYWNANTFELPEGGQLEISIDMVDDSTTAGAFAVLAFAPNSDQTTFQNLKQYFVSSAYITPSPNIYAGKYYGSYSGAFGFLTAGQPPGVHYSLLLAAETNLNGSLNARLQTRVYDNSITDPNDPARLIWQNEWVDTTNIDLSGPEASGTANRAPFLGSPGVFVFGSFNLGGALATTKWTNAVVRVTQLPPQPPIITAQAPAARAIFQPASTPVTFDVTDANNLAATKMSVTINGVTYNSTSGATVTGDGTIVTSMSSGGAAPNGNTIPGPDT